MSRACGSGRGLLSVAALAPIAAHPMETPADADHELIRLCEENLAHLKAYNRSTDEIDAKCDDSPLWQHYMAGRNAIEALPPQTLAGVVAKARLALGEAQEARQDHDEYWDDGVAGLWAREVVHDLLRLYGEG